MVGPTQSGHNLLRKNMKRVKTDREEPDERDPRWREPHYLDSYTHGDSLPNGGWAASSMTDPLTTYDMGNGAIATPLNLCSPTIGANIDQRIGRAIKITKVKLRCQLELAADSDSASPPGQTVRVQLVLDRQTNGAQMNPSALNLDAGNAGHVFATLASFTNPNGFGRFKILCDEIIPISQQTLAIVSSSTRIAAGITKYFTLKYEFPEGLVTHFNNTAGGTVTSIIDNSLHVVAMQTDPSNWTLHLAYACRVTFYNLED